MITGENMTVKKSIKMIAFILGILNIVLAGMAAVPGIPQINVFLNSENTPAASIAVSVNNTAPLAGQEIIVNAIIKDANGSTSSSLDSGTVMFLADGTEFASATITNGVASATFSMGTPGTATITAFFNSTLLGRMAVTFGAQPVPQLLVSANPTVVIAATPTGVTFSVTGAGAPVGGATVTLTGADEAVGTTDANGIVIISVNATDEGTITATASSAGFDSGTATLTSTRPTMPRLSLAAIPDNLIVATLTNVTFTVTSAGIPVSGATVTLTGQAAGEGTTDASGTVIISVNATAPGTITATATIAGFVGKSVNLLAANPADTTPPENVTNLTVLNRGQTFITWSWTNPETSDLSGLRILIDNVFKTNLPPDSTSYNATGLAPNTNHVITVIAFDTAGNNATSPPVNSTTTLPNTLAGENIEPEGLPSGIVIKFSKVTAEGNTTASFENTAPVAHAFVPIGRYVSITTTATLNSNITVTLNYQQPQAGFNENSVRLYHLNNTMWEDITTDLDTSNNKVTGVVKSLSFFIAGVSPPPKITVIEPVQRTMNVTVNEQIVFNINIDQTADIAWKVDNMTVGSSSNFTFRPTVARKYIVNVEASNSNGTDMEQWNVTAVPKTFLTGDRIWDERKHSTTYTWNPYSFSGFYYNLDDDLGSESLTIKNIKSTIAEGDVVYKTAPQEVGFEYSPFGKYEVIGFMADKYFAGYTANSTISNNKAKSALGGKQLHRVLLDDEDERTVSEGGTLTLKEGYVLKMTAVDVGAGPGQIWITLLKDGNEVDTDVLAGGETYVYQPKKVGSVSDLPILAVHFERVFRGKEINAAFIEGVFQISESYTSVKNGDRYGEMEIRTIGGGGIEMKNENSIDLSSGNTVDLMGDLKIIVADNSSVLRLALSVERTGTFEVRGTVYPATEEWTPTNFGMNIGGTSIGFYYDMDEDIGNEKLRIEGPITDSIPEGNLKYSTAPAEVSFDYSPFGSYEVIGFMADKYFAGYTANSVISNNKAKSALSGKQLHRVLLDDEESRTVSEGGTLTLKDGYVLKMTAVDVGAGPGQIWITLLKDGNEVDTDVLAGGETYIYQPKKVGSVSDIPILAVHFERVFRGKEINAAFIKGVFQISESFASVKNGDRMGEMEIRSIGGGGIKMENENSIDLSSGSTVDLMGNIKFRVADSNIVRFYPFVEVKPEMVANQLVIDAPAKANAGEAIKIKVAAGGSAVEGASITLASEIGETDRTGVLNYTIPRTLKGIYNITATKLGYQKTSRSIEVLEYIEYRLSIDAPAKANQFEKITIQVTSNGTAITGAAVSYDNENIGLTNGRGAMNYTLNESGLHTISAAKSGYITAVRDIEVRVPFSEYKALDINITPNVVFTDQITVIRSNITNTGTKADTLPVELIIETSVVDNRSVTLSPGEVKEINFTHKEASAGNYTVDILGQKGLLEVREEPLNTLNILLIAGMATGLGAVIIYLLTAKGKISLEAIRRRLNMDAVRKLFGRSGEK